MYQVFETVSGRRRYVGCSLKLATEMQAALIRSGRRAFVVKT